MLQKLYKLATSTWYWVGLMILGIMLETAALIYQYALDYYPCVLCIHVRIWVLGMIVVAALALQLRKYRYGLLSVHISMTILLAGLFERSYMLLGTERGFVFGDCNMDAGLPAWFALDSWFPSVFKVWEACGYTPVLLLGITMAEALIVMSSVLLALSLLLSLSTLQKTFSRTSTKL